MIGYDYLICPKGVVYEGRPNQYVPAASYGRNLESVNVSLIGNFEKGVGGYTGPPTDNQYSSLIDLAVWLHLRYPTITTTIGHRDVAQSLSRW